MRTHPFEVKSVVLQGGILFPLLFVLLIDYIMKKVNAETDEGIDWVVNGKHLDIDYADDIFLTSNGPEDIQRMLGCLVS